MTDCSLIRSIKICGVTNRTIAEQCAQLGFGAVGFVFYENSPRNINPAAVRAITQCLPDTIAKVGVFVDHAPEKMLDIAEQAGLTTLQLHGNEDAAIVRDVTQSGCRIVKVAHSLEWARQLAAELPIETSLLLECGCGPLPGGNGKTWNWAEARTVGIPLGIAGGLSPENFRDAVAQSGACAYDISSGVESAPGVKDAAAISQLAEAVAKLHAPPNAFWRSRLSLPHPF